MTTDLSIVTRDAFVASFRDQVSLRIPLLAALESKSRVRFEGGLSINFPVIKATGESLGQMYANSETGLDANSKSYLDKAKFEWKRGQLPALVNAEDYIENVEAASPNKILDLVELVVKQVQGGARLMLNTQAHATTAAGDSGTNFQSVPEAAGHSRTYGTITSSTSANTWWNGASLDGTWTDSAGTIGISEDTIRRMKYCCTRYGDMDPRASYMLFLPEAGYSKAIGIASAKQAIQPGSLKVKYGIESVELYGVEMVMDSYMTNNSMTTHALMISPETFELRLHPKRAFTMGDFVYQGDRAGGTDQFLARCLVWGNLVCKQPNANMYRSAIS